MAEIRDGTVKEVLENLRCLSYDNEEIDKRFDTVDRRGDALEDVRVRVYHHENDMTNLKRQVERGSAPLPHRTSRRELIDSRSSCTLGNAAVCQDFYSFSTRRLFPTNQNMR